MIFLDGKFLVKCLKYKTIYSIKYEGYCKVCSHLFVSRTLKGIPGFYAEFLVALCCLSLLGNLFVF